MASCEETRDIRQAADSIARSSAVETLFLIQERRDDFPRFLARHHRHDLEGHAEPLAVQDPFLQQPRVVAFHQLEATVEIGFDPAPQIFRPLGELDPGIAHALVDRDRIAVLETLDHHEEHLATSLKRRLANRWSRRRRSAGNLLGSQRTRSPPPWSGFPRPCRGSRWWTASAGRRRPGAPNPWS